MLQTRGCFRCAGTSIPSSDRQWRRRPWRSFCTWEWIALIGTFTPLLDAWRETLMMLLICKGYRFIGFSHYAGDSLVLLIWCDNFFPLNINYLITFNSNLAGFWPTYSYFYGGGRGLKAQTKQEHGSDENYHILLRKALLLPKFAHNTAIIAHYGPIIAHNASIRDP